MVLLGFLVFLLVVVIMLNLIKVKKVVVELVNIFVGL